MNKKEFRNQQRKLLEAFSKSQEKQIEDQQILQQLKESQILTKYQKIGITSSLPIEVDTSRIISYLEDLNKEIFLVKVFDHHQLHFLRLQPDSVLKQSAYGIKEVQTGAIEDDLDLYLVPGLAFDLETHQRLGFGGGYYDRFLAKHHAPTIALANSKMLYQKAAWPIEDHDLAIETIVGSDNIY